MFDEKQYLIDTGYLEIEIMEDHIGDSHCLNCNEPTGSYMNYCSVDCLHKELGDSDD